mgnify:CR=1 FL=1
MSNRKAIAKTPDAGQLEIESVKLFGKHVSREKGRALLAATMLACALPMLLGIRLWDQIPEIVPSCLTGVDGQDDSLPRWVVVFGMPGLMCVLNLIAHMQLLIHQKRMTMPPRASRLLGRWGFPVISVLFCSGLMKESAGAEVLALDFVTPCVLGLALMLLGAHMLDCPRDARVALRLSFCQDPEAWKAVHTFAGYLWLSVGLLVIAGAMITATSTAATALVILAALAAPVLYAYFSAGRRTN